MAGKLIPLDDAAVMLGKTVDELLELRSQNEISGYRDGSSWKFKLDEIKRFADEAGIELVALAEAGDLSSDADLIADSADPELEGDGSIDLSSEGDEFAKSESHVLSGSDVKSGDSPSDTGKMNADADEDLLVADDELFGSEEEIGLSDDSADELLLDSEMDLGDDSDDDSSLMLDESSEIALDAADSGVNLSPTDSGLSLDENPLELGGLELPEDSGIDLLEADDSDSSDLDLDADFELPSGDDAQADNDFMLTPLEGEADDESSGSQVIALEDSEIYADDSSEIVSDSSQVNTMQPLEVDTALPLGSEMESGMSNMSDSVFGETTEFTPSASAVAAPATQPMIVEQQIPAWMVFIQAICLIFLLAVGVIAIDIGRNMFEFNESGPLAASLTDWILDTTGYFKNS